MISKENFSKKQIIYCFSSIGEKICIKNDNIIIKDKENKIKLQTSCYRLFAIFIIGDTYITTPVIRYSYKFGFSIVLMSNSFKVYEILGFKMKGNTLLTKKQYSYKDLNIAKFFVENKIDNQIKVLKKIRDKNEDLNKNINFIKKHLKDLASSEEYLEEKGLSFLMGKEGICAKLYFDSLFSDVGWNKRLPRIKSDYINSTLDIGYTILFNYIESLLSIYGFDTYSGFLHREFYMRKSLVCDFVEPFRIIIDWQVRKSINLKQISEKDFKKFNNKYILKWENNKKYVKIFSTAINEYSESIFDFVQAFYRSFMKSKSINDYVKFEYK